MGEQPKYRPLRSDEIKLMEAGGTRAENWADVRVAERFRPESVVRCTFSGKIRLGAFGAAVDLPGGSAPSGVYESHLANATVADNALVQRVAFLSNYDVGPGACVFNCGTVSLEGESAFGNGCEIDVLNEAGGRELKIFDRLSAQLAYLTVCYRHRPKLIDALEKIVDEYIASRKLARGTISGGACVLNCTRIKNVSIGPAAVVNGALRLENGTIASKPEAPTTVGAGVVAEDFIISTGAVVDGRAIISACFVGQACKIDRQFSAEASAFFANCDGFHGEAVSVLAGPYTVSHHKSSLLIAGLYSFYNAGSGTNESNHMYKLGPLHQGILERGSKTGSFSYLLWPAAIGAFTAVIGKHYTNFDSRNLPFSYVSEERGRSVLSPAINLFTVGTKRDGEKWPTRDRRKDPDKLDLINFAVFSPLTVGRLMKGLEEVTELYNAASRKQEYVNYKGIWIKRLLCRSAKRHYTIAIQVYLGGLLADRLERGADLKGGAVGTGDWVDVLGLLAPKSEIETLCDEIESSAVRELTALEARLRAIHDSYAEYEWNWAREACKAWAGKTPAEMDSRELAEVITDRKTASIKLNNMILADAQKEFEGPSRIGFGLDGDKEISDLDFEAVRGTFEGNKFVKKLKGDSEDIAACADKLLEKLEK